MSLTIKNAYDLWKAGHDTFDIAQMTGRREDEIHREINACRSAMLRMPYPYIPYLAPTIHDIPEPMRRQGFLKARYTYPANVERNARIIEALASGKSMDRVADEFHLSKQRIWQISTRAKKAAA